jgi:hypothetical protein
MFVSKCALYLCDLVQSHPRSDHPRTRFQLLVICVDSGTRRASQDSTCFSQKVKVGRRNQIVSIEHRVFGFAVGQPTMNVGR